MKEVVAEEDTLKKATSFLWQGHVTVETPESYYINVDENRVELQDSRFNLNNLVPAKEFSFLNCNENVRKLAINAYGNFAISLSLSNKVIIHKRSIYSVLMMFGDVGGLSDFISFVLSGFLTFFADRMMLAAMVQKLFRISPVKSPPALVASRSL